MKMMEHFEETLIEINNKLVTNNHHNHNKSSEILNMDIKAANNNTDPSDSNIVENSLTMKHLLKNNNNNNHNLIEDDDDLLADHFGGELINSSLVTVNSEEIVELNNKTPNVKQLGITLAPANEPITTTQTTTTNEAENSIDTELEMSTNATKYKQEAAISNDDHHHHDVDDEVQKTLLNGKSVDNVANTTPVEDDDDTDDVNGITSDSDISNLSEISDISGRDWKPACARPNRWVRKQIQTGANPRFLLSQMLPGANHQFANHMNDMTLWRILATMLSEPPRRHKLRNINSFDDVVSLIKSSKNIIVLTGAGVSVSCGIPDFRSSDGIYARLAKDYPDLPDPQAMFDIGYFARDPRPFYKFAREIYPGQFRPSPCHRFIKRLEDKQKLLRNYTQNIDTLEQVAGIRNVIECHGSFSTASCTKCKLKCSADDIRADIFAQRIPLCPRCQPNPSYSQHINEPVPTDFQLRRLVENGIMKPDIVFFGEGLPDEFHTVMASDKTKCDLLIVIGSSLKVRPVALIPSSLPPHVPQILINREQLHHLVFDVQLLGDSDVIINQLCHRLADDFTDICYNEKILNESTTLQSCEGLLPLSRDSTTTEMSHNSDLSTNADETTTTEDDDDDDDDDDDENDEEVDESAVDEVGVNDMNKVEPTTVDRELDGEEETIPQQLDTDSQSVKSNASTDIALRSDSGFESSTSSGTNTNVLITETHKTTVLSTTNNTTTSSVITNGNITLVNNSPVEEAKETLKPISSSEAASTDETDDAVVVNNIKSSIQPCAKTIVKKHHKQKRRNTAECLLDGTYFCDEKKSAYVFPGAQVSWYTSSSSEDDEDDNDDVDDDNDVNLDTKQQANNGDKLENCSDDREVKLLHNSSLSKQSSSLSSYSSSSNNINYYNITTTTTTQTTMHNKQVPLEMLSAALANATIPTPNTSPPTLVKRRSSDSDENREDNGDHLISCSPPPEKRSRDNNSGQLHDADEEIQLTKITTTTSDLINCNSSIRIDNDNKSGELNIIQNMTDSVDTLNPLFHNCN